MSAARKLLLGAMMAMDAPAAGPTYLMEHSESAVDSVLWSAVDASLKNVGFAFPFTFGTAGAMFTHYFNGSNWIQIMSVSQARFKLGATSYNLTPSINFANGGSYVLTITYSGSMVLTGDATGSVAIGTSDLSGISPTTIYTGQNNVGGTPFSYGTLGRPVAP